MAIKVKDIYDEFPHFNYEDMVKLVNGKRNFKDTDIVPLVNIAAFKGSFADQLSIWTAGKEGESFIKMIKDDAKREKVVNAPGILTSETAQNDVNNNDGSIPMGKSIFDIEKEQRKTSIA